MLSLRLFRVGLVFVRLLLEIWNVVLYLLCSLYLFMELVEPWGYIFTLYTQKVVWSSILGLSLYTSTVLLIKNLAR